MIKTLKIINKLGLHARAANYVVKLATSYDEEITLRFEGNSASAKSMIELLILAAPQGSEIEVDVQGEDEEAEEEVMTQMEKLFAKGFYEFDD